MLLTASPWEQGHLRCSQTSFSRSTVLCPYPAQAADAPPEDSVINILVASDLHLGYNEKDPIRGEDSFVTFNEVFQIANERKVRPPPPPCPNPNLVPHRGTREQTQP